MKGYSKKQGQKLQRKVLQSLLGGKRNVRLHIRGGQLCLGGRL